MPIDPPVAAEVDGLRRAVGDGSIDRIGPHLTLVPPLNLRADDLDAALDRLHLAAASVRGPLRLTLGPPATFLPDNPVCFLDVGGDLDGLRRLRDTAFAGPLERSLTWPWRPHVTLADDLAPERIAAVVGCLDRYVVAVTVERVSMLEERHDGGPRRWETLADVALGPRVVVGRGGLEVTLVQGRTPDPAAAALLGDILDRPAPVDRLSVTARRDGRSVGVAAAWRADDGAHVAVVVEAAGRGQGTGTHLLAAVEDAVRREGWECPTLAAVGPAAFYRRRSSWSVAPEE